MKHIPQLAYAAEQARLNPPLNIAEEGMIGDAVEKVKAAFGKFTSNFRSKKDFYSATEANKKVAERNLKILVKMKQALSTSHTDPSKGIDLGPQLRKVGIRAITAKKVIEELKKRTFALDVQWSKIEDVCKDTRDFQNWSEEEQAAVRARIEKIKAELVIEPVEETGVEIKFTRHELIEVVAVMIEQTKSFIEYADAVKELKFSERMIAQEGGYEEREERERGGNDNFVDRFFEGIFDIIIFFFKAFLMFLAIHVAWVLFIASPVTGVLAMVVVAGLANGLFGD